MSKIINFCSLFKLTLTFHPLQEKAKYYVNYWEGDGMVDHHTLVSVMFGVQSVFVLVCVFGGETRGTYLKW